MTDNKTKWELFKEGASSVESLTQARLYFYYGTSVGAGIAAFTLLRNQSWGFGIFMFFIALLQCVAIISETKNAKGLKAAKVSIAENEAKFNKVIAKMEEGNNGRME